MGQLDLWLAVRGVAAAKEVVVSGRRTRPDGLAAALLDAVRLPGVQHVCVCEAWGGRENGRD